MIFEAFSISPSEFQANTLGTKDIVVRVYKQIFYTNQSGQPTITFILPQEVKSLVAWSVPNGSSQIVSGQYLTVILSKTDTDELSLRLVYLQKPKSQTSVRVAAKIKDSSWESGIWGANSSFRIKLQ